MSDAAIRAAIERAGEDAAGTVPLPGPDGRPRKRRLAIGDPQAPLETFFGILDRRGLLADDGRLRADVALLSLGDHFDWGGVEERPLATHAGGALLAWLAAHPPDQITVIAGNHDLARVGELVDLDDATFASARQEADSAYFGGRPRREESEFRVAFGLPSWQVAARDLSTFAVRQREIVRALLAAGRLRLAHAAAPDLLFCHAGITTAELDVIGLASERRDNAAAIADALNEALDTAVRGADAAGGRLSIPGLHTPGDARGEGHGMLYHRPGIAAGHRRFVPTALPRGLTQAIGHVADAKCRELLGVEGAPVPGRLRTLTVAGGQTDYRVGVPEGPRPDAATMIFLDGGMRKAPPEEYEMFDLDLRRAV